MIIYIIEIGDPWTFSPAPQSSQIFPFINGVGVAVCHSIFLLMNYYRGVPKSDMFEWLSFFYYDILHTDHETLQNCMFNYNLLFLYASSKFVLYI